MYKALTFRASSLGDALMAKYLLENVRAAHPDAHCGLVVAGRGAMVRDLLAAYPWIEVIEANRRSPRAVWHLLRRFWRSDFVVTPYTAGTVNLFTKLMARLLARRGALVGFIDKSRNTKFFCDTTILKWGRGNVPRLLEQEALKAGGVPVGIDWMNFRYLPQPQVLPRLGLSRGRYIVVHLFAGSQARGLSPESRQALVDTLGSQFPGVPLVFTGTVHDHDHIKKMRLPQNSVLPTTTVQEMAQLIDKSLGVVSVGTGPSHIASLLHKPLCVMCACDGKGWCGPEQYGDAPIKVFARPDLCPRGHNKEGYSHCMSGIDMQEIAHTASEIFKP